MQNPLRNIPSVNELLESPQLANLVDRVSHNVVVTEVRHFLDRLRDDVQSTASEMNIPTPSELAERIADWIVKAEEPPLRPVINATGILLHTGLGRAPLAKEAVQAMADVAEYASVELDLATGERSQRVAAVEKLLKELTGAEAAAVVNNNAAATLLTLAAIGRDQEVIVSRGQLIEIGGSFRLPDVMSASGTRLREVGTTNKTRIGDYEAAICENTAAMMRVHTSNFKVVVHRRADTCRTCRAGAEAKSAGDRRHRLWSADRLQQVRHPRRTHRFREHQGRRRLSFIQRRQTRRWTSMRNHRGTEEPRAENRKTPHDACHASRQNNFGRPGRDTASVS